MDRKTVMSAKNGCRLAAGGFAAGVLNGIFGSGGGVLIVFLLRRMGKKLDVETEDVYSNVTAAVLPMALASAAVYSSFSAPPMSKAVSVAAAALAGGALGAFLIGKIKSVWLNRIFAAVMIVSGGLMIFLK